MWFDNNDGCRNRKSIQNRLRFLREELLRAKATDAPSHTTSRVEQKIVRIEGALERIDSGTFGSCCLCGQLIDTRLLIHDPVTELCSPCQRHKANS